MDLFSDTRMAVAVVVAIVLLAAVAAYARRKIARQRIPPRHTEIARITEELEWTEAGVFCLVLLVLHQIGSLYFFVGAKGAIQEAAAAAVWIGGNVLWGLGVTLGRRRTYRIWRDTPKAD